MKGLIKYIALVIISILLILLATYFILSNEPQNEEIIIVVKPEPILTSNVEEVKEEPDEYEILANKYNAKMEELETISDKEQWFVEYKKLIEEGSDLLDPPETIYDCFNEDELDLLFRVVQAEIGDEYSFDQKANVASVIFNRVYHERFPNNLLEVLRQKGQFTTISNGRYKKVAVSDTTIAACEFAYEIQDTTNGALFFDSNNSLNYKKIMSDGAHSFYSYNN